MICSCAMRRILVIVLVSVALLIVIVGGTAWFQLNKAQHPATVSVKELRENCGEPVIVSGWVKEVSGASFILNDSAFGDTLRAPTFDALVLADPKKPIPSTGSTVHVRGRALCPRDLELFNIHPPPGVEVGIMEGDQIPPRVIR